MHCQQNSKRESLDHHHTTSTSKLQRKLNILTLGGSITWGAAIPDQQKAYPYILRDLDGYNIVNLGICGTGSDYPALCISSMLSAVTENQKRYSNNSNSSNSCHYHPQMPFDVVIFEFSINGFSGFELLLKRIQARFPDALLIYIDLWSLARGGSIDSSEARQMIKDAGGYVYYLGNKNTANPITPFDYHRALDNSSENHSQQSGWIVDLFADDRHHLSENGHALVKDQVSSIIEKYGNFVEEPKLGSWLGGDVCESWFQDGETSLQIIEGGSMNEYDVKKPYSKQQWAIEPDDSDSGLVLEYFHTGKNEAPLKLNYMTEAPDNKDVLSSKYPPVLVKIAQDEIAIEKSKRPVIGTGSDAWIETEENGLNLKLCTGSDWNNEGWTFISGLNKRYDLRRFHINDSSDAGMLKPGKNVILVYPMEKREYPFRLTATIVCEACVQLGFPNIVFHGIH